MNRRPDQPVVALGGAVADELVRLDANVVGATQDATELTGTLDYAPSAQTVSALQPSLVIADLAVVSMATVQQLRDAGMDVETVDSSSIKRTAGMIRQLGTFTGQKAVATRIANDLEGMLNDRLDRLAYAVRPVALVLSWPDPLTGCGPASLVHDVLWTAGIANALSGYSEPWPELEEGVYLGADVVLTLPYFDDWAAYQGYAQMGDLGELIALPQAITATGRNVFTAVDAVAPIVRMIHQRID
ncbi:hypothetical protein [Stomatohabitans albus]|uniref:ABC transporter substrate-binding protein n=1 Tax=Stomatohabitans albus TaxID=3110766 RepID=UPI00300D875A